MTADLTSAAYITTTERTALGMAMEDAAHAMHLAESVEPDHYAHPHHAALHQLIASRVRKRQPVDLTAIVMECARIGWGRFGGVDHVTSMCDHLTSAAQDLDVVIGRILDASARRRLLDVGRMAQELARGRTSRTLAGVEVSPETGREAADVVASQLASLPVVHADEWSHGADAWDAANEAHDRGERPAVWPTGMAGVDERLNGGLAAGKLYLIGGRPGWGKTSFATAMAVSLAMNGTDCAYFPMEVEPGEWQARCISILSGVPLSVVLRRHQPGIASTGDWEAMLDARDRMRSLGLHALDAAHVGLGEVVSSTRRLRARYGTKVAFVDYIQRMHHGKHSRQDLAIGETAVGLKNLARDEGIAVVACVQLNRGVDSRRGGRDASDWLAFQGIPRASDIREAGQLEQEADAILFPVHPVEETLELAGVSGDEAAVVWAKNRNGPPGVDRGWSWDGPGARFWDMPPLDGGML